MSHAHESNTSRIWKVFGILSLITIQNQHTEKKSHQWMISTMGIDPLCWYHFGYLHIRMQRAISRGYSHTWLLARWKDAFLCLCIGPAMQLDNFSMKDACSQLIQSFHRCHVDCDVGLLLVQHLLLSFDVDICLLMYHFLWYILSCWVSSFGR